MEESLEERLRVSESAICVHQKVVPDSDSKRSWLWSNKIGSISWEQCGEGTRNLALCVEVVDGCCTAGRP